MQQTQESARVHLRIHGRVQGVFFRASTMEQAIRLGLKGWVRNCPDGSVEAIAEGTRKGIDELARWCGHGPPGARVQHVDLKWEEFQGEFQDFRIRR